MSAHRSFLIHYASRAGRDFGKLALKYGGKPAVTETTGTWERRTE
jgi:hypothetical protein